MFISDVLMEKIKQLAEAQTRQRLNWRCWGAW
jgi:hypothetical protein